MPSNLYYYFWKTPSSTPPRHFSPSTTMVAAGIVVLAALVVAAAASAHGPFSQDFVNFLEKNPERNEYALSAFKEYGTAGTFGGRSTKDSKITEQPVLFVHGNSDSALHHSDMASGWTKSVEHFKERGYSGAELYGLTYGTRDINLSLQSTITCRNLLGLRRFIEAILEYTEAEQIDIVAHSMGVTLARKAIQGGQASFFNSSDLTIPTCQTTKDVIHLSGESCDLDESLSEKVDALVAISGANYGMCMCLMAGIAGTPACGQVGYAPGSCGHRDASLTACAEDTAECEGEADYAGVLRAVNADDEQEADFIASLWSNDDAILGKGNMVWGKKTSAVPAAISPTPIKRWTISSYFPACFFLFYFLFIKNNANIKYLTKDKTVRDQHCLVTKHSMHGGRAKRHHH